MRDKTEQLKAKVEIINLILKILETLLYFADLCRELVMFWGFSTPKIQAFLCIVLMAFQILGSDDIMSIQFLNGIPKEEEIEIASEFTNTK